jgi:hypothetical protein
MTGIDIMTKPRRIVESKAALEAAVRHTQIYNSGACSIHEVNPIFRKRFIKLLRSFEWDDLELPRMEANNPTAY